MSSNIQHNEPLWSKDDKGYWLLFPNKHALTKEHIQEIFAQYGKVITYTQAGDDKGFRFVQYAQLEEVEAAIKDLKQHPLISLIPHRPRPKPKQSSPSVAVEACKRSFLSAKEEPDEDAHERSLQSNPHSYAYPRVKHHQASGRSNDSEAELVGLCRGMSLGNQLKPGLSRSNSFSTISTDDDEADVDVDEEDDSEEIPGLASSSDSRATRAKKLAKDNNPPKELVYSASEIIVGNVHKDYGSAFVLHLLERYEPLGVSCMAELPRVDARYCRVYFRTVEDTLRIERKFDSYDLNGRKLVVLRPNKVLEEATARG